MNEADIDEDDPWSGILSAVMFATRATVHTTTLATPMQLVFGRDAILPIQHQANWKFITDRKQKLININNKRENSKRIPLTYAVGDMVMLKGDQRLKYGSEAYEGPYPIVKVYDNGTVRIRKGAITDTYNLRNIHPFQATTDS